jgi:hypothetical protein
MNTTTATPDATTCPLCGRPNECANEIEKRTGIAQAKCWCTDATFSANLLARVPPQARRLACICAACAAADVSSPTGRPTAP